MSAKWECGCDVTVHNGLGPCPTKWVVSPGMLVQEWLDGQHRSQVSAWLSDGLAIPDQPKPFRIAGGIASVPVRETAVLEEKLRGMEAAMDSIIKADNRTIQALTAERDDLARRLADAENELSGRYRFTPEEWELVCAENPSFRRVREPKKAVEFPANALKGGDGMPR